MEQRFDIVDLVTKTYHLLYRERFYLFRLGCIPVFLMTVNFVAVNTIWPDLPLLRRGLFLFPAMLAEAWMVVQFLRTVLTGERWPMRHTLPESGAIPIVFFMRARGLLSGIIFYFLVTLMINALAGVTSYTMTPVKNLSMPTDTAYETSFLALSLSIIVVFGLFNFRFLWLYIPLVVNMPVSFFLKRTSGTMINFHLIGLWLAVSLPIMLVGMVVLQPLTDFSKGDDMMAFAFFILFSIFNVVLQTMLALATSCAVALALAPFLFPQSKK